MQSFLSYKIAKPKGRDCDADAAQQNSLYFFQATWGYGNWPSKPLGQILADPMDLLNHLPGNSVP